MNVWLCLSVGGMLVGSICVYVVGLMLDSLFVCV
jgi:hypothetical protein